MSATDVAGRVTAPLTWYEQRGTLRYRGVTFQSSIDYLLHECDVEGHFMLDNYPSGDCVAMRKIGGRNWYRVSHVDDVIDFVPYVKPVKS